MRSTADALHATYQRDTLQKVTAEDPDRQRGHTIPKQGWWCQAATEAADKSGLTRAQLAAAIHAAHGGGSPSTTKLIRTLRGDVVTWDLALAISRYFALPPPLIECATLDEALLLLAKKELHRVSLQVAVLQAGVASQEKPSHTGAVKPQHGGSTGRKRRRVGDSQGT